MMQSDLAARKMPGGDFFVLAGRAGCSQVFFGVESVNRKNLRSQEKFQNQVTEYKDLVAHCHSLGITCQAGYILGLPFDTPASLKEDIAELQNMMFDAASFYILSPLPGSKDHQRWWKEGRWMDPDFNTYDSAHVAVAPDGMTREELMDVVPQNVGTILFHRAHGQCAEDLATRPQAVLGQDVILSCGTCMRRGLNDCIP